jgi:serine/threonine protein kinase/dipeptidyl aminopeptidase/acylaminoacyl peptidase
MGEVYRARDSRLRRDVALKILRNRDSGHRIRLLEEARAASALNHPNILVVYDIGVEHDVPFIVSELVDGVPLRQLLAHGPLPLKELLDIAVQIADGLTAAHEAGFVHCDLKPENVMVTPDGRVKILDFGVAKIETPVSVAPGASVLTETANGLISGTVPYMSPEQARGREVDFRSDQFSVGLVLYEMAAGARAFARETAVETLSAIIADDPLPLTRTNPKIPILLSWIVDRCLAKRPHQRYAATADLARDLRMLRDHLTEANVAGAISLPPTLTSRPRWWPLVCAAAAGAAVTVLLAAAFVRPSPPPTLRYTPLANDSGYQGQPAWSPDGKMVAYTAQVDGVLQIFKRSLSSSQRSQITHSLFDCRDPFWSPDSSRIYYLSLAGAKDGVLSVSAAGGPSEPVMLNAVTADLSPDGSMLAFLRDDLEQPAGSALRLWLSSPPGGEPHRYTRGAFADRVFSDGIIRFAPDGSKLGVWVQNWASFYGSGPKNALWIVPMNDADPLIAPNELGDLPNYPPHFDWLSDSRRIVAAVEQPTSQGLHLSILDTKTGTATRLTSGAGSENTPAVSPDGRRIAYAMQDANFDLIETPIDGSPATPLLATTRNEMEPAWSPTNAEFTFVTDRSGRPEIWRRSQDGSWELPLVTEDAFPEGGTLTLRLPVFSPDGQRIAFERVVATGSKIWIATLAGGAPVQMTAAKGANTAPTWSPDGEWIAFALGRPAGWSLAKARVGVAAPPLIIRENIAPFTHPQWSPDNRWIACNAPEGLTVVTPDGKSLKVLDEDPWFVYGWGGDGSTLYGIKQDPDNLHRFILVAVDVRSGRQRIVNGNLAPVPPVNAPMKGFTRMSAKSFATSLVRVKSDLWLIDDFQLQSSLWGRLKTGGLR